MNCLTRWPDRPMNNAERRARWSSQHHQADAPELPLPVNLYPWKWQVVRTPPPERLSPLPG